MFLVTHHRHKQSDLAYVTNGPSVYPIAINNIDN